MVLAASSCMFASAMRLVDVRGNMRSVLRRRLLRLHGYQGLPRRIPGPPFGGETLQRVAILASLPFAILMVVVCWALYRTFPKDLDEQSGQEEPQEAEEPVS